jgi:hypothetical protein
MPKVCCFDEGKAKVKVQHLPNSIAKWKGSIYAYRIDSETTTKARSTLLGVL